MKNLNVKLRIDAETGKVKIQVSELEKSLDDVGKTGNKAGDNVSTGMQKAKSSTNQAKEVVNGMRSELVRLASVGFAAKLIKDAIGLADQMKLLNARLDLVTNSQAEYSLAQSETTRIALETHTAIGTTVSLYTRLERSLQGQSVAQTQVLQITETINKAMGLSNATASETSSVITQLSQGLAAGVLRGEEFNSVNESGSRIMQALKDDLGKTSGELREMAFAGELTTEVLTKALLNQSATISKEFETLPLTVSGALTDLKSRFTLYASDIDDSIDVTGKLSRSIKFLGDNLETIIDTVVHATTAFIAYKSLVGAKGLVLAFGQASAATAVYEAATGSATAKVGLMSSATGKLNKVLKANPIGIAVTAGFLAFEYLDGVLDDHEKKVKELNYSYADTESIMTSVFDLVSEDKEQLALTNMGIALDEQIAKLKTLKETRAEILGDNELDHAGNVKFKYAGGLTLTDIKLINIATDSIKKQKELIEDINIAQEILKNANGELTQTVKSLGKAYQYSGRFLGIFGLEISGIISNEQLLAQQTQENTKSIEEWVTANEKQLEQIRRKNKIYGLSAVQIIELDAATKKALTTDAKQLALIDKSANALLKETKAYDAKLKTQKQAQELIKKENKLIQKSIGLYESKQRVIDNIIDSVATDQEQTVAKYENEIAAINEQLKITYLSNEQYKLLLQTRNRLTENYNQSTAVIKDETTTLEDLVKEIDLELDVIKEGEQVRLRAIAQRELEAAGIDVTAQSIDTLVEKYNQLNQAQSKSNINKGVKQGFASLLSGNFDGFISAFDGVLSDAANNIGQQITDGFAAGFSKEVGGGLSGGLSGATSGLSSGLAAVPVAGWIYAGLKLNEGLFDAGWKPNDGEINIELATALFGLTPAVSLLANRLFQSIGISEKWAAILSGSALLTRLFGRKAPVIEQTGFNATLSGDGVSGQSYADLFRKGGVFRSDRRYTEFADLSDEVINQFNKIKEGILSSIKEIVEQIGTDYSGFVDGTLSQTFDKDGELTGSTSTFFGVTRDESSDEFVKRLQLENIIAALGSFLPDVEVIIEQIEIFEDDFGDAFGSITTTTTKYVSEIHGLAENYRDDVEQLAEFTQFATQAVTDLANGNGLLDSITATLAITEELKRGQDTLLQTYSRLVIGTELATQALGTMGINLDLTQSDFIKFADGIIQAAGGLEKAASLWESYFSTFYTSDELLQNSINTSSDLLGQQATELGVDPNITAEQFRQEFEARLALGQLTQEQIVQWLEFGKTIGQVNNLVARQTEIEQERVQALLNANAEYDEYSSNLKRQLDDINGVNNALNDIESTYKNNINSLNNLAIAAGKAGASDQDLANAHALYVAQIKQATQSLFDQLYGDDLDSQIAALEASQTTAISNVASASVGLFSGWTRAIDNLRDYTRSRLVDDFSPLEAKDRLAQAQADFNQALVAAQGGDLEAAQSLVGLAQTVDSLNQAVNASGNDYNQIYYAIQNGLNSVTIPDGISNVTGGGSSTSGGGVSAELQALYDLRDARLAEQTSQNRLVLATQLAEHLNALAGAVNKPLFEIAGEIGVNMRKLVGDLGVNLDEPTVASVKNLANISKLLDVNLTDLATNLGDDVSLALGSLADDQSLLNDALEQTITGLPAGIQNTLTPLLRDVETAADGEEQERALRRLEEATGGLPAEYRNLLAPYFENIDPITQLDEQIVLAQTQVDVLNLIYGTLSSGSLVGPTPPVGPTPSFAVGTSFVQKDTLANIHKGEMIIDPQSSAVLRKYGIQAQSKNTPSAMPPQLIKAFDDMSKEIRQLKYQLTQLNDSNDTIAGNTGRIDDRQDEIVDNTKNKNQQRSVCGAF